MEGNRKLMRDRKLIRNVVVHPQRAFFSISGQVVVAHEELLSRRTRNHPVRKGTNPSLKRPRLTTEPQLREEVVTAIGARRRCMTVLMETVAEARRGSSPVSKHQIQGDCVV